MNTTINPGQHFIPINTDGLIKGNIVVVPDPEDPNFTNTTTKENTVMSITQAFTDCIAINKGNHKKCQSHQNKIIIPVMVKAGEAVHEDLYKSGNLVGWFRHELPFCIGHGNQLLKGKKIMIQSLKALPQQLTINDGPIPGDIASDGHPYRFSQFRDESLDNCKIHTTEHADCCPCNKEEDTMDITTKTIEELEDYLADLFETGAEISRMGSFAYETEEEYQAELASITDEFNKVEALIIQKKKENVMSTTKKILCGKCHEKHDTPAEVAACYGIQRKSNTKTSSKYGRKPFTDRREAVQFLKGLGACKKGMENLPDGSVKVWWEKS